MSIDLSRETPIPFSEAAAFLPIAGRPNTSTWWRWHRRGIRGIRLETIMIGGRRCTSAEALRRFFDKITAEANHELPPETKRPDRTAALEHAEQTLNKAGI